MRIFSNILKSSIVVLFFLVIPSVVKSQEYGRYGVGLQNGIWAFYGPSFVINMNRNIGFESIVGCIKSDPETNSNLGFYERLILRPITYKSNSLYAAGMLGSTHWHFMGPYKGDYVEAYEWGFDWGLMGGAEIDFRLFFPKFIPLFINVEGGIEHRSTKYTTSNTYPTYGFGIHYRF